MGKKNRLQKKKGGGDAVLRSDVQLDEQFTRSAAVTKQRKRKAKDDAKSDDEDVEQVRKLSRTFLTKNFSISIRKHPNGCWSRRDYRRTNTNVLIMPVVIVMKTRNLKRSRKRNEIVKVA